MLKGNLVSLCKLKLLKEISFRMRLMLDLARKEVQATVTFVKYYFCHVLLLVSVGHDCGALNTVVLNCMMSTQQQQQIMLKKSVSF